MIDYNENDMMRAIRWLIFGTGLIGFVLGYAVAALSFGLNCFFHP
jgi:hypothetical protein